MYLVINSYNLVNTEKTIVIKSNKNGDISSTYDKHIILRNMFTNESVGIQMKLSSTKVEAIKLVGKFCSCYNYEPLFQKNSWEKTLQIIKSSSIVHPFHYQTVISLALEKLANKPIVVPDRANYIRSIILELERIQCHLLKLGTIAKGISYPILHQRVMLLRRDILVHIENITQPALDHPFIKFGGVSTDIVEDEVVSLYQTLSIMETKIQKIKTRNQRNPLVKGLLKDVGFISRETAKNLSLVGPLARTSGITTDVRQSDPYCAYKDISFNVPVSDFCDLFGEFLVLFDEIIVSIKIVRELLQTLPEGSIYNSITEFELATSNTIVRVETPIGELFSFVHSRKGTEKDNPRLFKITCPMKVNTQGLLSRITGNAIDNVSTILLFIGEGWGISG